MLLWASVASALPNKRSTEQLLSAIDRAIDKKEAVQQKRIERCDSLLLVAKRTSGQQRLDALFSLYYLYESFQTDSTLSVLNRIERTPEYAIDTHLRIRCTTLRARTFGMMGLYADAYNCLEEVQSQLTEDSERLLYYNALHTISGWRADYCQRSQPELSKRLRKEASLYHDSIAMLEPDEANRIIVRTNKMYDQGNYIGCIDTLLANLDNWSDTQQVYAYSRLAQAYDKMGDSKNAIHYLALTALGDLEAGNTEYMALPLLAQQLFLAGDGQRAYYYLLCSLEDATFCNAGLRTVEASAIFPIIDRARMVAENTRDRVRLIIFLILIVVMLLLAIGTWGLLRQHRRLNHVREALAEANSRLKQGNKQLQAANQQLQSADKVKEEYLMKYLTRSRRYLSAMESFQRQLYRLLQARQTDELAKQLKSNQFMADEQAHFYTDFDEAFLALYPNFIEDFNTLLLPEAQIIPKRGELLTTELRIFALIRLGETDSNQIAKFLGYSLTTIYNYRSRVRNNAIGDKEKFEENVAKL
ncbi:MAG: DUF6377 domain-containing protein [Bacteroidales bacterium]|nr:DUF6377 domain-containing protein [Bacteroidales bacterium]